MAQLRNFVFTLNNPTVEDYESLMGLDYEYLIIGEEVGDSGTYHLQGYCELTNRKSFDKMKKELPRAYLAGRKGSQSDAIKYCKKGEKYHEFGNPREQGSRKDITAITKLISEGSNIRELISNEGEINLNVNTIRLAEKLLTYYEPPRDYQPTVLWLWGATGCGKSCTARTLLPEAYFNASTTGKWWGGYDGHQDVILDDVREETFPYSLMLAILGAHPVRIEDKGTIRQFRGRRIIVTSPYGPSETSITTIRKQGAVTAKSNLCRNNRYK